MQRTRFVGLNVAMMRPCHVTPRPPAASQIRSLRTPPQLVPSERRPASCSRVHVLGVRMLSSMPTSCKVCGEAGVCGGTSRWWCASSLLHHPPPHRPAPALIPPDAVCPPVAGKAGPPAARLRRPQRVAQPVRRGPTPQLPRSGRVHRRHGGRAPQEDPHDGCVAPARGPSVQRTRPLAPAHLWDLPLQAAPVSLACIWLVSW